MLSRKGQQHRFQVFAAHLHVVVIFGVHGAQQAPRVDRPRRPLHLGLQRQHRLAQHAAPEQILALPHGHMKGSEVGSREYSR